MIRHATVLEMTGFGCYGKLPLSREFVVEGTRSLPDSGFDRWISEGVGLAKARLGPRFDGLISGFPRYRFVWDGGDDHLLAGVICPSEDAASRKHPFALFACLRGQRHSALATALQVCSLQEHCAAMLASVAATESPTALREAIRSAPRMPPPPEASAQEQYQRFLAERLGDAFWRDLVVRGTGDDGRFTVLQALVETLAPLNRDKNRAFRGGIRYPLSHGSSVESALEACFWLDLTEGCLGHALGNNSWLRSGGSAKANNRHFFLFLSPPSGSQWVSLIDPEDDLDSISYLDRPYGSEAPEQRMDPTLRAILTSASSTFGDYLSWASGS